MICKLRFPLQNGDIRVNEFLVELFNITPVLLLKLLSVDYKHFAYIIYLDWRIVISMTFLQGWVNKTDLKICHTGAIKLLSKCIEDYEKFININISQQSSYFLILILCCKIISNYWITYFIIWIFHFNCTKKLVYLKKIKWHKTKTA